MLVDKITRGIYDRIGQGNINWMGDSVYLVDTTTEQGAALAEKIKATPYFDFVEDEEGNLIDITPGISPIPPAPHVPTTEERVDALETNAAESEVDMDYRISVLELGL